MRCIEITANGASWSYVGSGAINVPAGERTMCLNLQNSFTDEEKMSIVLHEFGHALGLEHEHQRSDFWKVLGEKDEKGDYKFIIGVEEMKKCLGCQSAIDEFFETTSDVPSNETEQSVYDPNSIMHYR